MSLTAFGVVSQVAVYPYLAMTRAAKKPSLWLGQELIAFRVCFMLIVYYDDKHYELST